MSITKGESEEEENHQHLPAIDDWPHGFDEASWWPFITAFGASGIYLGAGLIILKQESISFVNPNGGSIVLSIAIFLFLSGLGGWVYQGFVKHYWKHTAMHETNKYRWGILLFIGSEIATFGSGFVYYFFIRVRPWPPTELPELLSSIVLINTLILISSSGTLHLAPSKLRAGKKRQFLGFLGFTIVLGILFILGQVWEYYEFIVHKGYTITSGIYFSAFFGLTGLHGLHVTLGVILLSILFIRGLYGQYSKTRHTSVNTVTLYWHFVDAVWVFLVLILYIGATIQL